VPALTVSVVGLRGHAARHINLVKANDGLVLGSVYYHKAPPPDAAEIPTTADIRDCFNADAIIIASPTGVHEQQLAALDDYKGYILVEKPAVNQIAAIDSLLLLSDERKGRIRVGFNFVYSDIADLVRSVVNEGRVGKPFMLRTHFSHGLAFRSGWADSWRAGDSGLGPLETLGVHFAHFASQLFGEIKTTTIHGQSVAGGAAYDSGVMVLAMDSGAVAVITTSYAAPQMSRIELWGSDGFLDYDGHRATVYAPRDTFDATGRFTTPPVVAAYDVDYDADYVRSLQRLHDDFFQHVRDGLRFAPEEFDRDVAVMRGLLTAARM
jgi:predicted dehydrogenase